jgi:mannosyltransferase
VILASLALRLAGQHSWFWIDEALSVGIASHPLRDIPGLLRQDGSPPLYYMLLHVWMRIFGRSETATHALSLVFGLAAIPVAFWAARRLFGRRAGWYCAALVASAPFITSFSRETRMYTLVMLLSLATTAFFLFVFARREHRYLPGLIAGTTVLLYTHNWSLFLCLGFAVALVPCVLAAQDRRQLLLQVGVWFGAVIALYAPWLPTLWFQSQHTGAPWSTTPALRDAYGALGVVLGDLHERVLVLIAVASIPEFLRAARRWRSEAGRVVIALVLVGVVTLLAAWGSTHLQAGWANRYFGIFLPPLLLFSSWAFAKNPRVGAAALVIVLFIWVHPLGRVVGSEPKVPLSEKSTDRLDVLALAPLLAGGDLVVSAQMERVPVLEYYLPSGLRYASPIGKIPDPKIIDWRDAERRMQQATVTKNLVPLLAGVKVHQRVLIACPWDPNPAAAPQRWRKLIAQRCVEWLAYMVNESSFVGVPTPALELVAPGASRYEVLFERRRLPA